MAAREAGRAFLGLGSRLTLDAIPQEHSRARLFYREVARTVPWIVRTYKLEELTSTAELRRTLADRFREYADVKTPEAIDRLIYKGREELELVILQHKQRHHLIDGYLASPAGKDLHPPSNNSAFLDAFYAHN